ncbi:hypothetical protein [Pontibacter actiniarum]|uniref:Uncharacterized protein n=1 Tax=Pontibacter actiniarum TaxID=323450 RepID=A0A1X9YVV3_9BACT|nr:hypothetical protein [Pontibacter actiniarum]ARS36884.1 hypothetical protein CA264_16445 [Pontibacter actiniarum]
MTKIFTSAISDLNRLVFLLLPLSLLASCSTRVEPKLGEQQEATAAVVAPKEVPAVTVAAIENTSDEVYFDLIAKTSNCLGEDLWLGGKLESESKAMLAKSGALSQHKIYKITELTATGLNSNSSYLVNNKAHTLRAVVDKEGVIYLQLSQGQLQLMPQANEKPLVLAYQPNPSDGRYDGMVGRWSCK